MKFRSLVDYGEAFCGISEHVRLTKGIFPGPMAEQCHQCLIHVLWILSPIGNLEMGSLNNVLFFECLLSFINV